MVESIRLGSSISLQPGPGAVAPGREAGRGNLRSPGNLDRAAAARTGCCHLFFIVPRLSGKSNVPQLEYPYISNDLKSYIFLYIYIYMYTYIYV